MNMYDRDVRDENCGVGVIGRRKVFAALFYDEPTHTVDVGETTDWQSWVGCEATFG